MQRSPARVGVEEGPRTVRGVGESQREEVRPRTGSKEEIELRSQGGLGRTAVTVAEFRVVSSPEAVRALEADRNTLLLQLRPEPAIAVPRMVRGEAVQHPNQKLLVIGFRPRCIAVRRTSESEDLTSPAFGEGEMRADEFDALPPPSRA